MRSILAAALLVSLPSVARAGIGKDELAGAQARVKTIAAAKSRALPLAAPRVVIHKADRVLVLYDGDVELKRYDVALGRAPIGPKREQGDFKTPEGSYFVTGHNAGSQFHLFLGLSYPNAADAKAALDDGRIDAKAARAIEDADHAHRAPPWDGALGGAVGIHGGGTSEDWTFGCIALSDDDVDELWVALPDGAPIEIDP